MGKKALLLAGGGARGSFQVGMLQELVINQGIDFQVLRGVSVGALNAAFLAQAPASADASGSQQQLAAKVTELGTLWLNEIEGNSSIYSERSGFAGLAMGADSLYSLEPLRDLIGRHISLEKLMNSGRDFAVGTVSLTKGTYEEWDPVTQSSDFMERFIASASIPVVFPFVDLKETKEVLVDGGVRNITPLSSAFRSEPEEIYILLTSRISPEIKGIPISTVEEYAYDKWQDNFLGTKVSGLDVLKRTLDILTDEVYLDDIRRALHWNDVAVAIRELESTAATAMEASEPLRRAVEKTTGALQRVNKRHVPINVIAPRKWFAEEKETGEKNSSIDFDNKLIRKAIEHGSEVAADKKLWVWPPA